MRARLVRALLGAVPIRAARQALDHDAVVGGRGALHWSPRLSSHRTSRKGVGVREDGRSRRALLQRRGTTACTSVVVSRTESRLERGEGHRLFARRCPGDAFLKRGIAGRTGPFTAPLPPSRPSPRPGPAPAPARPRAGQPSRSTRPFKSPSTWARRAQPFREASSSQHRARAGGGFAGGARAVRGPAWPASRCIPPSRAAEQRLQDCIAMHSPTARPSQRWLARVAARRDTQSSLQ